MGKRVYDPIHDTYQIQGTPEPPILSKSKSNKSQDAERDSESTQSEPTAAAAVSASLSVSGKKDVKEPISADSAGEESQSNGDNDKNTNSENNDASFLATTLKPKVKVKEPSRYTRHLKKSDGEPFTRKDIQFEFLSSLLSDERELFTNPYKDFFQIDVSDNEEDRVINVTDVDYNSKPFIKNDKLTFSQIYILTIASSNKCSKVLRDKLLFDHHVAFSTCILSLLVNMGRLNTTVNFFLEMTSQLRTFHSIPCLQHYSTDPKSLQDTPRIKSILKTIPLGSDVPIEFHKWYRNDHPHKPEDWVNPISLLFAFCEQHAILDWNIIIPNCEMKLSLFQLFDDNSFEPKQRVDLFLWLIYIHLETDLTPESLQSSKLLFGLEKDGKFVLEKSTRDYDIDTPVEVRYGEDQLAKRIGFLNQTGSERTIVQQTMETASANSDSQGNSVGSVDLNTVTSDGTAGSPSKKKEPKSQPVIIQQETQRKKRQSTPSNSSVESKAMLKAKIQKDKDERMQAKIDLDKNYPITDDLTQDQLREKLIEAQKISNMKRHEIGLMKMFDEFEDVPLATIIGIRGKKRKKFSDGILGYETDMLGVLRHSKRLLLHKLQQDRNAK